MVAVLDFQNALSIFLNIKSLQNVKPKLFVLSLCFREKDKIKEIKQKDQKLIYEFLGRDFQIDTEPAIHFTK